MFTRLLYTEIPELLTEASIKVKAYLVENQQRASLLYVAALLTLTMAYMCFKPVGSGDTDLWFHMNGGRLFWDFDQLPQTAFYSFFDPQREWINYYWAFQALTSLLHDLGGYEALIVLRVLLIAAAFTSVAAFILRPGDGFAQRAWALIILVLIVVILEGRTNQIRPHLFSYALIPLFLYILEYRRAWLPLLPVLTVVWINVHGVEWPVGAAICGAYFLEALWQWWRTPAVQRQFDRRLAIWTLACLPATFVNPFGPMMLTAPFNTPPEMYLYIQELQPYPLDHFFIVVFTAVGISVRSAVALLSWGNLLAYLHMLAHGRFRVAPVLLSIVGLILLTRGSRFIWEWMLLSLPLWRMAVNAVPGDDAKPPSDRIEGLTIFVLLVLISPAIAWMSQAKAIHHWPLDAQKLPVGVAGFLRQEGVEGRMLAPVNYGGYLAWSLYPKILVSGDMQGPPTTAWDHFRRNATLVSTQGMQRVLDEFAPNLIAVERTRSDFGKLIAQYPNFRPVFVDDLLVLYADENRLPSLTQRHSLRHVAPFEIIDKAADRTPARFAELQRMLDFHPRSSVLQHAIVRQLFDEERYEQALPYAQRFVQTVPEEPNSHFLLGNVLENLDRCEDARPHYEAAFAVADKSSYEQFHRHLATCAYLTRDFTSAYGHFIKGLKPYSRLEPAEYMYQFAFSAATIGHDEKARIVLNQLLYTLPDDAEEMRSRATGLLADL